MAEQIPIYYQDQSTWGPEEFNYLNSYLNRLFLYEAEDEKSNLISRMNLAKMSQETIALIGAILSHYGKAPYICAKYPNLNSSELWAPLESPLRLNEQPVNIFPSYKNMNILY